LPRLHSNIGTPISQTSVVRLAMLLVASSWGNASSHTRRKPFLLARRRPEGGSLGSDHDTSLLCVTLLSEREQPGVGAEELFRPSPCPPSWPGRGERLYLGDTPRPLPKG
jgi:hypothetical protein